jgi:hypothetical protein
MRRRFDALELVLIAAAVALFAAVAVLRFRPLQFPSIGFQHPDDRAVAERLARAYGPGHYSGGPEEWIIRDVLQDARGGIYADVGAFKAIYGSNTYYLEHDLGWRGLAVDAVGDYADEWRRERPRAEFVSAFVDAVDGQQRTLHISDDHPSVASATEDFVALFKKPNRAITVTTATLDSLLTRAHLERLDFISLDIELGEPAALAGFSIDRYRPRLVCVEAQAPVRQAILDYFTRHRYRLIGRYLKVDDLNLYFEPLPE